MADPSTFIPPFAFSLSCRLLIPTDRIFFQALSRFQHVRIYANSINDVTVPYVTAAIETEDPFLDHAFNGVTVLVPCQHCPTHFSNRLART